MSARWFCQIDGNAVGPMSAADLREMADSRNISRDSLVRKGDDGEWLPARKVKGLFANHSSDDRPQERPLDPPDNDEVLSWLEADGKPSLHETSVLAPDSTVDSRRKLPVSPRPSPRSSASPTDDQAIPQFVEHPKEAVESDESLQDKSPKNSRQHDEKCFFDEGGVLVTATRFVVDGTLYPISSIAGVTIRNTPPNVAGEVGLMLIGAGIFVAGLVGLFSGELIVAMPCIGGGAALFYWGVVEERKAKSVYAVVITTVAGQVSAVTSYDKDGIERINRAVESAIIARG